jgi:DNA mismatch repair protein MutS
VSRSPHSVIEQYLSIKDRYKDCLVFFQIGEFYELFFEDAEIASQLLDLSLTQRNKYQGAPVPMCGVPISSYEDYVKKLLKKDHKIALCMQKEDLNPSEMEGKRLLTREVVRLLTPGTVVESVFIDAPAHRYLVSIYEDAYAALDISTGDFGVFTFKTGDLKSLLMQFAPKEVILPKDSALNIHGMVGCISYVSLDYFNEPICFPGHFSDYEIKAACALICYINNTGLLNKKLLNLVHLKKINAHYMRLSPETQTSLELFKCQKGEKKGYLFDSID